MITWLEEKLGLPYQTWHKGQDIGVRLLTQVLKEADIDRADWISSA